MKRGDMRYGYCERTDAKVPYGRLVPDGEIDGILVAKGWEDQPHPQRIPIVPGPDGLPRGGLSAPPQDDQDRVVTLRGYGRAGYGQWGYGGAQVTTTLWFE